MSNKLKLKRITDLFSEGDVCFLGDDENAKPVCVWITKPNSIEEEESRLDAQSARTEQLVAMANIAHPEIVSAHMTLEEMTDEEIYEAATNMAVEKLVGLASLDIESNKEWEEKLEYLRRHGELMDDADVKEDDPRRVKYQETNQEYMDTVEEYYKTRKAEYLEELKAKGRVAVEEEFVKEMKDKLALDYYMLEKRITQLYYAVRECEAERKDGEFTHSNCDHGKRLFEDRKEIRELPENVLTRINTAFDEVQVGARNVANFPEATSS